MTDKYGKIHTDGSRSGGQPVVATQKAHTAMLEVLAEWGIEPRSATPRQLTVATTEALCRAIEQHEDTTRELGVALRATSAACADHVKTIIKLKQELHDFRQEVSDAVVDYLGPHKLQSAAARNMQVEKLNSFIIPQPKPDPLVEAIEVAYNDVWSSREEYAAQLRAALDALGFEIREKGQ